MVRINTASRFSCKKILKLSAAIFTAAGFSAALVGIGGGYNPLVTSLGASLLAPASAEALSYQTSVDQSFTINDTLTITLSDSQVSIEGLLPGQSADSSILDVTVMSNNPYGYKLTGTVGNSNYTADALYNTADSTKALSNIGFGNNKSSLGDFDPNTWGYSYSTDGGTTWKGSGNNTGYTGLPLYSSANTATLLDTSDISAETGDTVKFKLGAKASSDKEPGRYNNTINFVATGYSIPLYTVTYNANGGTVSPASESTRSSVTLPTPSYSGYTFQGWCDGIVASSTCSGTTYDAGDTYTPGANVTLTAMWKMANLFAISTMQEMTSAICAATTTPLANATSLDTDGSYAGNTSYVPQKTLTDTRGGSYVVRKLADGNCWMVQNLNLTLTAGQSLTNTNTDLNSKASWDPGVSTSSSVPSNSTTSSTSYTRGNKWCSGTAESTSQTCNNIDTGDQTNHVGILYNWYAATAGTGTADLVSSSATDTTDATDSICPKGWQLPSGGRSNKTNGNNILYSFYNLLTTSYNIPSTSTGSVAMRSMPLSIIFSGYYYDNSLSYESNGGYYWSSSAYTSSTYIFGLGFNKTNTSPQGYGNKGYGRSIRCVAR